MFPRGVSNKLMSYERGYLFFFAGRGRGGSACALEENNYIFPLLMNRNSERLTESLAVLGKDRQGESIRGVVYALTCTLCTPSAP